MPLGACRFASYRQFLYRASAFQPLGVKMLNLIKSFVRDESGASAAEYALILAIVGAGIAVAAGALGTAVSTAINSATAAI